MEFIPINKPQFDQLERDEVLRVLEEGNLTSASFDGGKRVQQFERQLEQYLKVKHVIAVNSGTSALHAALLAGCIGAGDEVILPSFTFVATANAVVATGAKPVFIDIDNSYTVDPDKIEGLITPKTKAVIPVHLYGHLAEMSKILEVARKYSLLVIEDACQSLGASYFGKQTGSIGDIGCFSMYASKVLTSGEGGAVSTNNDSIAVKLRMIRNHGMVHGYDTQTLGLNMRLPEMNAALATIQMKKLPAMLEVRRRNAKVYCEVLNSIIKRKEISLNLPVEGDGRLYNWYLYTVSLPGTREQIKNHLNDEGIGATVYYNPPVHKTPYYLDLCPDLDLPVTQESADDVLSLPVHPSVSEIQVQLICEKIKEVFK